MRKGMRDFFVCFLLVFVCFCFGCSNGDFGDSKKTVNYNYGDSNVPDNGGEDGETEGLTINNEHLKVLQNENGSAVIYVRRDDCPNLADNEPHMRGDFPKFGWGFGEKLLPSSDFPGWLEISIADVPPDGDYGFNWGWGFGQIPNPIQDNYAWYSNFSNKNPCVDLPRKCYMLTVKNGKFISPSVVNPAAIVDPNSVIEDPNNDSGNVTPAGDVDPNFVIYEDPNSSDLPDFGDDVVIEDPNDYIIEDPNNDSGNITPAGDVDPNFVIYEDPNSSDLPDFGDDVVIEEIDDFSSDGEIEDEFELVEEFPGQFVFAEGVVEKEDYFQGTNNIAFNVVIEPGNAEYAFVQIAFWKYMISDWQVCDNHDITAKAGGTIESPIWRYSKNLSDCWIGWFRTEQIWLKREQFYKFTCMYPDPADINDNGDLREYARCSFFINDPFAYVDEDGDCSFGFYITEDAEIIPIPQL